VLPQVESTATQVERVGLILSRLTQLIYSDPGQHVQLYTQTRTTMHTYTNTRTDDTSRALAVCAIYWHLRHTA
jgi:hypothetical protein